ncbi:hypothetical protein [Haloarcula sediminis]|uniref:hypothetical protein n=1 Tax=Haloarcula sediminis TaxID=3111777 RepID=UPI002D78675E|nr:hypothetical protein [Haloarcula sp. CK38]
MINRPTRRAVLQAAIGGALSWGLVEGPGSPDWDVTSRTVGHLSDAPEVPTPFLAPAGGLSRSYTPNERDYISIEEVYEDGFVVWAGDDLGLFDSGEEELVAVAEHDGFETAAPIHQAEGFYYQHVDDGLLGVDTTTNTTLTVDLTDFADETFELEGHPELLCAADSNRMVGIERASGDRVWSEELDAMEDVVYRSIGDLLIVSPDEDHADVFDFRTGEHLTRLSDGFEYYLNFLKDGVKSADGSIVVHHVSGLFGTTYAILDGETYRGYTGDFEQQWKRSFSSPRHEANVGALNYLTVERAGSRDLIGIDLRTAETLIRISDIDGVYRLHDRLYVLGDGIRSIATRSYTEVWSFTPDGVVTAYDLTEELLYALVRTDTGVDVVALSLPDGNVQWRLADVMSDSPYDIDAEEATATGPDRDMLTLLTIDEHVVVVDKSAPDSRAKYFHLKVPTGTINVDFEALTDDRLYLEISKGDTDQILVYSLSTESRYDLDPSGEELLAADRAGHVCRLGGGSLVYYDAEDWSTWQTEFDGPRTLERVLLGDERVWVYLQAPYDSDLETDVLLAFERATGDRLERMELTSWRYDHRDDAAGAVTPEWAIIAQPASDREAVCILPSGTRRLPSLAEASDLRLGLADGITLVGGDSRLLGITSAEGRPTVRWDRFVDNVGRLVNLGEGIWGTNGTPAYLFDPMSGVALWRTAWGLETQAQPLTDMTTDYQSWLTSPTEPSAWLRQWGDFTSFYIDAEDPYLDWGGIAFVDLDGFAAAALDRVTHLARESSLLGSVAEHVQSSIATSRAAIDDGEPADGLRSASRAYRLVVVTRQLAAARAWSDAGSLPIVVLSEGMGRPELLDAAREALVAGQPRQAQQQLLRADKIVQTARALVVVTGLGLLVAGSTFPIYRYESARERERESESLQQTLLNGGTDITQALSAGRATVRYLDAVETHRNGDLEAASTRYDEAFEIAERERELVDGLDAVDWETANALVSYGSNIADPTELNRASLAAHALVVAEKTDTPVDQVLALFLSVRGEFEEAESVVGLDHEAVAAWGNRHDADQQTTDGSHDA